MVRYAEWRETVDPERPLERYDPAVRLGLSALAGIVLWPCCFVLGPVVGYLAWQSLGTKHLERRVRRLRDEPARFPQFACRLTLMKDGTIYGNDEGLLSLAEGFLLFEGRTTSFSVPRANAVPETLHKRHLGFHFGPHPQRYQASLEGTEELQTSLAFYSWLKELEEPVAAVVFPPVVPSAARRRTPDLLQRTAIILCPLALFIGIGVSELDTIASGLVAGAFATLPSLLLWNRARQLRRAFEEMERSALEGPTH